MTISSWLSWHFSSSYPRRGKRPDPAARPKKARFTLEPLEARALLASYTAASVSALIADINAANTNGGANTITLTAATTAPYGLTAVNNTTYGPAGLPVIAANDNLTIVGGGDTIERSTAAGTPIFRLFDLAVGGSLTLQSLTLQGGYATSVGGAIYNQGALTLSGVTVQQNHALIAGGGIYCNDGSVTLEGGSSVSHNFAGNSSYFAYGGGLYAENSSTVIVTDATLDNNCVGSSESAYGGAICVYDSTVNVTNATLNNNSVVGSGAAGAFGGGLYAGSNGGGANLGSNPGVISSTVTVTNTTLDSNILTSKLSGYGGGLCMYWGTAILSNDTVESNTATTAGGGVGFIAGTTATLSNDTVESNAATAELGAAKGLGGGIYIGAVCTITMDSFTVANTINNTDGSGLNGLTANIRGKYTLIS